MMDRVTDRRTARKLVADIARAREKPAVKDVYFVQGRDGGPIKIGSAIDVSLRIAELQVGSPVILVLLGELPLAGVEMERELHRELRDYRLHGEWFRDCDVVRRIIEKLLDEQWERDKAAEMASESYAMYVAAVNYAKSCVAAREKRE